MDTPQPAIHLADLIDTRLEQPGIWVAYPGSKTFEVLVRPLGNRQQEFVEKSQRIEWDVAHMAKRTVLDGEQYMKMFCAWVIEGWRGLTGLDLARLVLLETPKKARLVPDIACDEAAKILLMRHSPAFNNWINQVTRDIERFNSEREEDTKKKSSPPSASGSTTRPSTAGSAARISAPTPSSPSATPARSAPGTGRPSRSLRSITWPCPAASWNMPGWLRPWMIWIFPRTAGLYIAGWCSPSTAR
jgi:hypothetical protein